jgi:hypothetical protein
MNNAMMGMLIFVIMGIVMIIFGVYNLTIPFRFKEEKHGRFVKTVKKKNGLYAIYEAEGKQYTTFTSIVSADVKKGDVTFYTYKDQCMLKGSTYFIRGVLFLVCGGFVIAMGIRSFS